VAAVDYVEVRFGHSNGLRAAQALLASLGILAILISPANWIWKLLSILLLILLACFMHARSVHEERSGTIRLDADGTAVLRTSCRREVIAAQGQHGWVSRWFSVMTLYQAGNGGKYFCVICAAENHPDEYRRLLKFLRMRTPPAEVQRMVW
jgi:hypothetical protein